MSRGRESDSCRGRLDSVRSEWILHEACPSFYPTSQVRFFSPLGFVVSHQVSPPEAWENVRLSLLSPCVTRPAVAAAASRSPVDLPTAPNPPPRTYVHTHAYRAFSFVVAIGYFPTLTGLTRREGRGGRPDAFTGLLATAGGRELVPRFPRGQDGTGMFNPFGT